MNNAHDLRVIDPQSADSEPVYGDKQKEMNVNLYDEQTDNEHAIIDDVRELLEILPEAIGRRVLQLQRNHPEHGQLVEIVMDLGRPPEARFQHEEIELGDIDVTRQDLAMVAERIGTFGDDNRAGIERTLHRISAIRNRTGEIVGLTCRIGRAVFGTIAIISDLIESGESVLILGRPGVGKTTLLRETARVLADELRKRVVVVDTSNEIAGDGDIPHPAIGRARRMQVPTPNAQDRVMIEAVENHMPQVVVIDEIGTELEAMAARTIAERGVQLIGTAHGNTLENLMINPTLTDLIGGIQSVTLSDEEARRRGTQKSILERKAPPTFGVMVEIVERDEVIVHKDVASTVDALLRGAPPRSERRKRNADGSVTSTASEDERRDPTAKQSPGRQPIAERRSNDLFDERLFTDATPARRDDRVNGHVPEPVPEPTEQRELTNAEQRAAQPNKRCRSPRGQRRDTHQHVERQKERRRDLIEILGAERDIGSEKHLGNDGRAEAAPEDSDEQRDENDVVQYEQRLAREQPVELMLAA